MQLIMKIPFAPKNVLVVDDDPLVVTVLTHFLEEAGYAVTPAGNGREGLEQYRAGRCDVVITDRAMPEMSGEELAAELGLREPDLPIVLITGCREAIAYPDRYDAILIKPFRSDELLNCVAQLLELEPEPSVAMKTGAVE
jgi:CheY-like chemotaxis protein